MDLAAIQAILDGEGTNEEKSQKLFAAHESDKKALEASKNKILEEKKALQKSQEELLSKIEPEKKAYEAKVQELEEQIKKGGSEEAKAAFEAQLNRVQEQSKAEIAKIKAEIEEKDKTNAALRERRRLDKVHLGVESAMSKANVTDPEKRQELRKAFLYDYENKFKLGDDDTDPVDDEYKTIDERMLAYVATPSGKTYLPANSTGGGATGSTSTTGKHNTLSREKFNQLSPKDQMDFCNKGGTVG